ncbi:MAG: PP2C family protein-serine/threonine phosphatase [Methylococcales bacterium]
MIAQATDRGNREHNEDYHVCKTIADGTLLMVADGLGGHRGGKFAAHYFCAAVAAQLADFAGALRQTTEATLHKMVRSAAESMQARIATEHPGLNPRTTVAMAWLTADGTWTLHVGDSRFYLFGPEGMKFRTRDHSVAQLLVDQGEIKEHEMAHHPDQATLLRSIGGRKSPKPTITPLEALRPDEGVLLCSDGFWGAVKVPEMQLLLTGESLQTILEQLVSIAVARACPNSDNVTAIFARPRPD